MKQQISRCAYACPAPQHSRGECGGLSRGWFYRYQAALASVQPAEWSLQACGSGGWMAGCEWRSKAEALERALVFTLPWLTSSANSFLMLLALTVNSLIFQFIIFSACSPQLVGWIYSQNYSAWLHWVSVEEEIQWGLGTHFLFLGHQQQSLRHKVYAELVALHTTLSYSSAVSNHHCYTSHILYMLCAAADSSVESNSATPTDILEESGLNPQWSNTAHSHFHHVQYGSLVSRCVMSFMQAPL